MTTQTKRNKALAGVSALLLFIVPVLAFAQIENPLGGAGGATTIQGVLINVSRFLLGLVALLALLSVIVGGIWMILAFGREDQVRRAKQIITWAVIGLIVSGGAYAIISMVAQMLGIGGV
jgi:type II secretory pathway component PulF